MSQSFYRDTRHHHAARINYYCKQILLICSVNVIMATMHKSFCQVNTVHLTGVYLRPPIRDVICPSIKSTIVAHFK